MDADAAGGGTKKPQTYAERREKWFRRMYPEGLPAPTYTRPNRLETFEALHRLQPGDEVRASNGYDAHTMVFVRHHGRSQDLLFCHRDNNKSELVRLGVDEDDEFMGAQKGGVTIRYNRPPLEWWLEPIASRATQEQMTEALGHIHDVDALVSTLDTFYGT